MHFYITKFKNLIAFFLIFDSDYFQAIEAAVLYKKYTSKNFKSIFFMFLGLLLFCDKN